MTPVPSTSINSSCSILSPFLMILLFCFLSLLSPAASISFQLANLQSSVNVCPRDEKVICLQGDAYVGADMVIHLTPDSRARSINNGSGRATFSRPVQLWDRQTGRTTSFTSDFSFQIDNLGNNTVGDGFSFFLVPYPSRLPHYDGGKYLALSTNRSALNATRDERFVAVEFDTFQNVGWDPKSDHVGIDISSMVSVRYVNVTSGFAKKVKGHVRVSYDSRNMSLSVFFTYPGFNSSGDVPVLSHAFDIRDFLPELVAVGFSAATGDNVELHNIFSWNFTSSLEVPPAANNSTSGTPPDMDLHGNAGSGRRTQLVVASTVGPVVLIFGFGFVSFCLWRRGSTAAQPSQRFGIIDGDDHEEDPPMDDEIDSDKGPRSFTLDELAVATGNFAEERKLGQGGFGPVYKGFLRDLAFDVAVKAISKGSKQGRKEYKAEVTIISQLRHRNLVQLVGWCHQGGHLLLVYEFMPNGSLDKHLFNSGPGSASILPWAARYNIALGLASALCYLHEEWEQCVVHRDIKSSNVMLDSAFNARLGDFGLARLVDHGHGMQTTCLAGTMGYLAPESFLTGRASKESDIYSFGVVALEIACGRRTIEPCAAKEKLRLVDWVWELYGRGALVEAADERLGKVYDRGQVERLMAVGLWCCHPDAGKRPSIRQAINVLSLEAPVPDLPLKMPVPVYYSVDVDKVVGQMTLTPPTAIGVSYSSVAGSSSSCGELNTASSCTASCKSAGSYSGLLCTSDR